MASSIVRGLGLGSVIAAGIFGAIPELRPLLGLEASDVLIFSREPVAIRPQFGIQEEYNDNIFFQQREQVEDFITTISPGLEVQVGRESGNFFLVGYTYSHLFYADRHDLNDDEHLIQIRNKLEGNRLTLTGNDQIGFLSTPLGGIERTAAFLRQNVSRTSFFDNYNLAYSISEKTSVYVEAQHAATDYEEGVRLYDIQTLIGTLGFAFLPSQKTSFFGEFYYGQTTTEGNDPALPRNPDMDIIGGFVGARGKFTEGLTGMIKGGYETREFTDGSDAPSAPVVEMALTQAFSEKTRLSLTYSRRQDVSVQFSRVAFTADLVNLQLSQILGARGKWTLTLGGGYGRYDYDQGSGLPERIYDRYTANFNLAYRIQIWLSAILGYNYEKLETDSLGLEGYDVNRVSLRLAIGY